MADLSVQTELSAEDLNRIIDGVAMRLNGRPSLSPAALNGIETANYLGISRARFYEILEVEKELAAAAITIGSKRIWPVVFLNHLARQ